MWTSQTSNHQQEGFIQIWLYITYESSNFLKSFYILATSWNMLEKSGYFVSFFFRNLPIWAVFFSKILCGCQNHIFEVEKCENLPKIITMPVTIITCKKMEKTGKTRCVFGVHELIIFTRTWLLKHPDYESSS